MSYVPKNVRDLVAANELYAGRQAGVKDEQRAAMKATWADKDAKRQTNSLRPQGLASTSSNIPFAATQALSDAGKRAGLEAVKAARQARLKEKLEREALQYEAELNARGLALARERD